MRKKYIEKIRTVTFIVLAASLFLRGYAVSASEASPLENLAEIGYEDDAKGTLEDWDYTETKDGIILVKYIGGSTDIVIPGTIDGKQVFLQNSGGDTGLDRFPENTNSIIVGNTDQKVKVTNENAAHLFSGLTNLTYLDAKGLDTSDITSMNRMFFDCSSLIHLDVRGWDTGRVTDMAYMFQACNSLTSLDVREWDTSNVTSMYSMFRGCNSLVSLDVRGWDVGSVTEISCMFYSCTSLTELDLSGWDTSRITGSNMDALFYNCSGLTSLDISGWNTSNVTSMQNMFFNCSSLTGLDLSSWDTGSVTSMNYMFYYCSSLTELNLSGWNTGRVKSMLYMFNNCSKLQILDLSGHDYGSVLADWHVGVFDLIDGSAMLPTLIISNDPLIQKLCDEPIIGRVPAGPYYHFGDGVFAGEEGESKAMMKYFDTLLVTDINDFTVSSIANKYIPEKAGAVFVGWYLDEACTRPFEEEGDSMRLTELIHANLYARYLNQYTVTFVNYDGSIIKESLVLEGDAAIAPEENPVREGYRFIGWDREFENIIEDMVIKALYEEENKVQEATDEQNQAQEGGEKKEADLAEYPVETSSEVDTEADTMEAVQTDILDNSERRSSARVPETSDASKAGFYLLLLLASSVTLIIRKTKKMEL